jgi:uncharacterized C2H2 Zn-finger protein
LFNLGRKNFKCGLCDRAFGFKSSLSHHIKTTHTKSHICDLCDFSTHKISLLERHSINVHPGSKYYKCDDCDKAFDRNANLQAHINAYHKKIRRFFCDLCDFSSYGRRGLTKHSNAVHLGLRDFRCDHCDQAFQEKKVLAVHVNRKHEKTQIFSCQLCNYTSYAKRDLTVHNSVKHHHEGTKDDDQAQKDQMFLAVEPNCEPDLPETYRSPADQNEDQKYFVQVTEGILETKEIVIKEELDDVDVDVEDDPLAFV